MNSGRHQGAHQYDARHGRPEERFLQTFERTSSPRNQRSHAREKQQEEPDWNIYFIEEGRVYADLLACDRFGDYREQSAPQNGEAARHKNQVVEQEAGFAGDYAL